MQEIPFSPVDYIFTGAGSQPITFAFSFNKRLDQRQLHDSLEQTIKQFPVVRSKLQRINDSVFSYKISDDGLLFSVRETDKLFTRKDRTEDYIEPVQTIEDQPLTRISLTQTPGGSVLGVSMSHALVDGFSFFHFMSSWARLSRGDRILSPHIPRDIFSPYIQSIEPKITGETIYRNCGLFLDDSRNKGKPRPISTDTILIRRDSVKELMNEVRISHNVSVSENDVITATLWKKFIPIWSGTDSDRIVYITSPFDFRRVLTGFPRNYFGCALCFATTETTFGNLQNTPVGELAILIKQTISGVKEDYIKQSLSTLDTFRRNNKIDEFERFHLRHPRFGVIVTNLSRLPVNDLDFGYGKPESFIAYAEIERGAAILSSEDGFETFVTY